MKPILPIVLFALCTVLQAQAIEPRLVDYTSNTPKLRGYLWRPSGDGPFPAIVYNHGSEKLPGDKTALGEFFALHGYVFFVPHRRGHGRSEGTYVGDQGKDPESRLDELVAQRDDVVSAYNYLRAQSAVDVHNMFVMGCSYGGIETLLTAELPLDLRAAVDFAGASMSWSRNAPLQTRLKQAVAHAQTPIFFLQAENDFNIEPSKILAAEAEKNGKPYTLRIFPPHGSTHMEGHAGFCNSPQDWGDDVMRFLQTHRTAR